MSCVALQHSIQHQKQVFGGPNMSCQNVGRADVFSRELKPKVICNWQPTSACLGIESPAIISCLFRKITRPTFWTLSRFTCCVRACAIARATRLWPRCFIRPSAPSPAMMVEGRSLNDCCPDPKTMQNNFVFGSFVVFWAIILPTVGVQVVTYSDNADVPTAYSTPNSQSQPHRTVEASVITHIMVPDAQHSYSITYLEYTSK